MPRGTPNDSPRARQTAAQETQARRRRRGDVGSTSLRLRVDESLLDRDKYEYRWIADRDVRMHRKTHDDDWDVVKQEGGELKADASDLGAAVSVVSGVKKDGSPERQYLCRKLKTFHDADMAEKEAARKEVDEQMRTLARNDSPVAGDGAFFNAHSQGRNAIG